jgi:predicted TPR repeat methyltransferase
LNRWIHHDPENPVPRHLLIASLGKEVPPRAQDDYVRNTFDSFSYSFDQQLARLKYCAPQLVFEALQKAFGSQAAGLEILDAGCGTGLCAPLIRSFAKNLTGVDLSAGMLEKARKRGGYDELHEAELTEFISRAEARYDAIISADTLCYFGDLHAVMSAARRALRPGGRIIFSVEKCTDRQPASGFHLTRNGRYTHLQHYIERVLRESGLSNESIASDTLRLEYAQPVEGLVVVARKDS